MATTRAAAIGLSEQRGGLRWTYRNVLRALGRRVTTVPSGQRIGVAED